MLADVVPHLICPLCRAPLSPGERALTCVSGHAFDIARQGYVNLLPASSTAAPAGDTAEMVRSRAAFLDAGHFAELTAGVVAAAPTDGLVVDVGAGTGHYLAAVLASSPDAVGLAVDTSKFAARVAARAHQRIGAVVADVWRGLPVASGSASVVLDVFAPRNGAEFRRVLRADGRLVVAVPRQEHLGELVSAVDMVRVDARKWTRVVESLPEFALTTRRSLEWTVHLDVDAAVGLVLMGPSAHHVGEEAIRAALAGRDEIAVTAAVDVLTFAPR